VGPGHTRSKTRHPLICRVYTGSLVYSFSTHNYSSFTASHSLVVLNHIKYHSECTKTHYFQNKNSGEARPLSQWGGDTPPHALPLGAYGSRPGACGVRPRIVGETSLLSWTTSSTVYNDYNA